MASIKKPASYLATVARSAEAVVKLMPQFRAVDQKGRYLHWHDFKHRVPAGIDADAAWAAVKLSRAAILKSVGLYCQAGTPFSYCLPDSAQTVIHQIDQLNARLGSNVSSASSAGESNSYLVESLMMEEAISSAQLEGAVTTRKVAKQMLEKERAPVNDDERMIVNNFLQMKLARHSKDQPLSLELIRQFHAEVTQGIDVVHSCPGEIRQNDDIFVVGRDSEIAHQPPAAASLPQRLEALCRFANQTHDGLEGRMFIHPAVKAIILHFMIGYEHPFNDGNGRTARCLFYWYMLKCGYWSFEYVSISALLKNAPMKYGESYLFTETDDLDLTYFIGYQLSIIQRAINDFLQYIERKRNDFVAIIELLTESGFNKTLNFRQIHLLKKLLRNPGRLFTAKEVKNDFDISENTARTDLEKLYQLKLLGKSREGKTWYYIARDDAMAQIRGTGGNRA